MRMIGYDEGLAVAERIKASRYLGTYAPFFPRYPSPFFGCLVWQKGARADPQRAECSAKMGRGVREAVMEAARVAVAKGRPVGGVVPSREGRRGRLKARCVVL